MHDAPPLPGSLPGGRGALLVGLLVAAAALLVPGPAPVADRVVRVEGEVARPGWYEAPTVAAAVSAAGGTPAAYTNREAPDGATLTRIGDWAVVQGAAGAVDPVTPLVAAAGRVRLNQASLAELEALPGVGPVLAGRIVAARPYRTVEDLDAVKGIGPATLRRLRPLVAP